MGKRGKGTSRHHILPTSQGGSNEKQNIITLPDTQHRAIHNLFDNQLIARQLMTVIHLSEKALKPEVREWLIEVLQSKDINDPYERYREECIK